MLRKYREGVEHRTSGGPWHLLGCNRAVRLRDCAGPVPDATVTLSRDLPKAVPE
jgi:hypothetical protein